MLEAFMPFAVYFINSLVWDSMSLYRQLIYS